MQKFRLNKLVSRPAGTVVLLRPPSYPLGAQKSYEVGLNKMLEGLAKEIRASIIPAYEKHNKLTNDTLITDADEWFERFKKQRTILERIAEKMVSNILGLEAKRHTKDFHAQAKKALGIDIGAVVRDEDLEDYLKDAVARNVSLIKGMNNDLYKKIEQSVYNAKINGASVKTLRAELQHDLGVSASRAKLIARDQMSKINGDMNKIRQFQAGVTKYTWQTVQDERVRDNHASKDGNVYSWDKPPSDTGHPSEDIQCRCQALAVIEFD